MSPRGFYACQAFTPVDAIFVRRGGSRRGTCRIRRSVVHHPEMTLGWEQGGPRELLWEMCRQTKTSF